jgi:hypothetical protein
MREFCWVLTFGLHKRSYSAPLVFCEEVNTPVKYFSVALGFKSALFRANPR